MSVERNMLSETYSKTIALMYLKEQRDMPQSMLIMNN